MRDQHVDSVMAQVTDSILKRLLRLSVDPPRRVSQTGIDVYLEDEWISLSDVRVVVRQSGMFWLLEELGVPVGWLLMADIGSPKQARIVRNRARARAK
jgi:hypothetical protein